MAHHAPLVFREFIAGNMLIAMTVGGVFAFIVLGADFIHDVEARLFGTFHLDLPSCNGRELFSGGAAFGGRQHVAGSQAVVVEESTAAVGHFERRECALADFVVDGPVFRRERIDVEQIERGVPFERVAGRQRLGLFKWQHLDENRTRADIVERDFDLGERHTMDERPDADDTFVEDISVLLGEDQFVVEIVFELVADLAQFDVVPCAVVGAALRNQRIQNFADKAFAAARNKIGFRLLERNTVLVHRCPILGEVLVPFRAGDGVA